MKLLGDLEFIEKMVKIYGEERRSIITDSLEWVVTRPWYKEPFDKEEFVKDLLGKAK